MDVANRLRAWVERLVRIRIDMQMCRCALAELGVVNSSSPRIRSTDAPGVVRAKETLLALMVQKKRITKEMARVGAQLLDEQQWEVLVPGGPVEGGFLSWTLGERAIGYYRETNSLSAMRRRLPGVDPAAVDPIRH